MVLLVDSEVAPMPSFDDIDKIVSASGILAEPAGVDASASVPGMYVSGCWEFWHVTVS